MKKILFVLSLFFASLLMTPIRVEAKNFNESVGIEQELNNKIVIRNMDDLNRMNERDVKKYDEMLEEIPRDIKEKYNKLKEETVEERSMATPSSLELETSITLEDFLMAYPEYRDYNKEQLEKEINLLRFNPVVTAVRTFLKNMGYKLSLTFFNHSLTPDPADSTMDMTGNTSGMYGHVKGLLYVDGFVDAMVRFSRANSSYSTISNSSDWIFDKGDLYWSIHGFTWKRTRTKYDKAYFKIIDVYDFNKWQDVPGMVAGFAETNDFNIELYGLVENGTLQ